MTALSLRPYDVDNETAGTVFTTATQIVEDRRYNRNGSLTFRFKPGLDAAGAAAADEERWIRLREDGTEVRAYRVEQVTKIREDSGDQEEGATLEVRAVGALSAPDGAGVWFQGEGKRYAYGSASATRWFGFMSDSFDDTSFAAAYTFEEATVELLARDAPFGLDKHLDHPDPGAKLIWSVDADGATPPVGECFFRDGTFVVASNTQVIIACAARHEFELYLDGTLLLSASHPEASKTVQTVVVDLKAGTHTLAIRCEALAGPGAPTTTEAWLTASVVETVDGIPTGDDEVVEVDVGAATDGTFTLTVAGVTTQPIDWDASASQVRDAVEATGVDDQAVEVSVSGTGQTSDPWKITFDGWRVARRNIAVSGSGAGLTGGTLTVTEATAGSAPTVLWRTGDDPVKVDAYPSSPPGVTIGEIVIDVVDQATARGVNLGLHGYDVTATLDSDGVAWANELQVAAVVGRSIAKLLEQLVDEAGVDIDMTVDGDVQVWQRRSTDRTATVDLDGRGAGVGNSNVDHSGQARKASHALIHHNGGWTITPGPGRRRETFLQFGQVGTDEAAARLGAEAMRDLQSNRRGQKFERLASQLPSALVPGDLVTATDYDRFQVTQRVVSIGTEQRDNQVVRIVETTPQTDLRRGPDRLDETDLLERVARAVELMIPGTGGGRVRSASPVRWVDVPFARAFIGAAPFELDAIADQTFDEEEVVSFGGGSTGGAGTPTYTSSSTLPDGLTFADDGDGTWSITGTVAVGSSANSPFSVTVEGTSADGQSDTETFTATVAVAVSTAHVNDLIHSALAGSRSINEMSFQPSALLTWGSTKSNAGTSRTWTAGAWQNMGVADAVAQYAFSAAMQDGVRDANRLAANTDFNLYGDPTTVGSEDGSSTFTAFVADGFDFNVNADTGRLSYMALGFPGMNVKVVEWAASGSTGNQAVTGVGFTPDVVIHMTFLQGGSFPLSATPALGCFGAMDANGGQWSMAHQSFHDNDPTVAERYQDTANCITRIFGGAVIDQASYVSMDADGFTVNWGNAAPAGAKVVSLCIGGVNAKVGSLTDPTVVGTKAITGVGFEPQAVLFASTGSTAAAGLQSDSFWMIGAAGTNDLMQSVANAHTDADGVSSSDCANAWTNQDCVFTPTALGAASQVAAMDSFDADGFTLDYTAVGGSAIETLYLALAPA